MADIFPALRYRDGHKAIAWLEQAFGFKPIAVYEDDDGSGGIAHAELNLDGAIIMLGSSSAHDIFKLGTPNEIGRSSSALYIAVDNVDALYQQAKAAGADIIQPPEDKPYGGRDFSCRDPEGHLWSFGTYRPEV